MAKEDELDIEHVDAWSRYSTAEPDDHIEEITCPVGDMPWPATCETERSNGREQRKGIATMLMSLIDECMSRKSGDPSTAEKEHLASAELSGQGVYPIHAQLAEGHEKAVFLDLLARHITDPQISDLLDLLGDVSDADECARASFMEDLWQRRRQRKPLVLGPRSSGYVPQLLTDLARTHVKK